MNALAPAEKTKLDEVARLMLEIYKTLARMRYLDPAWIQPGPHKTDALIPMYRSHGIGDSIIYLYSILPYVDTACAEAVDFFQGGGFADFRMAEDVERGRDPFYADSEEEAMRPWMTPLSMLGNHKCVIIYSAKSHRIWILDQESGRSYDRGLRALLGDEPIKDESEEEEGSWDTDENESEGEKSESGQETAESDGERYESDQGTEGGDEDVEDSDGFYDEADSRPAVEVLRDIIRWYHDLTEMPGGGENSGSLWDKETTKPLYSKHGWPGDDFDGDAFLVDLVRPDAARSAEWAAEEPLRKVAELEGWAQHDDSLLSQQLQRRLAAATTVDEEWLVRWELWQVERGNGRAARERLSTEKTAARLCPDGQAQRPEDLPLWELEQLKSENSWQQENLERVRQETRDMQQSEKDGDRAVRIRLRHAEQKAAIYQKAYEASKLDAERLCPGKTFKLVTGFDGVNRQLGVAEQMEELAQDEESARQEVEDTRAWMAQLPDGVVQAKALAEDTIREMEGLREGPATRRQEIQRMTARCQYCADLFLGRLVDLVNEGFRASTFPQHGFYPHHRSFGDLEQAAGDGCEFCQLILDCFKGTPKGRFWPVKWEGPSCDPDTSMYAAAMALDDSDVKISISTDHIWPDEPFELLKVFDTLLVQVGRREHTRGVPEKGVRWLPTLHLRLSTARDQPIHVGNFRIGRRDIDPVLDSKANFDIARSWLAECSATHQGCPSDVPELPTRVIDVGNSDGLRLFLSRGAKANYAALSHCWGGKISPLLTTESLSAFQNELPYSALPLNFQDAIKITRELGIRYLWIDSLCIIQNSKHDWEQESKHMGRIYQQSTLTISALVSKGSTAGILSQSAVISNNPKSVHVRVFEDTRSAKVRVERQDFAEEDFLSLYYHCPLSSRGWTLQEYILPPRHLFFGTNQIFWRCLEGFQTADGTPMGRKTADRTHCTPPGLPSSVVGPSLAQSPERNRLLDEYYQLVLAYSRRNLTFGSDKLPAFSGLAQRFHPFLGDYLAGIWSSDFRQGLLWQPELRYCEHAKSYQGPSWSWAATNQRILLYESDEIPQNPESDAAPPSPTDLQLIDFSITHSNRDNPFGEIKAARLVVTGLTFLLVRSRQVVKAGYLAGGIGATAFDDPSGDDERQLELNSRCTVLPKSNNSKNYLLTILTQGSDGTGFDIDEGQYSKQEYLALLVLTNKHSEDGEYETLHEGLVIQPVGGGADNTFQRVGYLNLDATECSLESWKTQTINLV
ncbi:hypothetical protein AK830_g244 [Neonectria ditissima]|uniref:Heterokaryon incompatibility domain-containing protein n=1 Tax=Neonectria ditissima TaxID=78410 RepID=A0A0P7BWC1_9HYPO|nr:hypothetical protein AK830_g244 [Neonectria ditissima]